MAVTSRGIPWANISSQIILLLPGDIQELDFPRMWKWGVELSFYYCLPGLGIWSNTLFPSVKGQCFL